MSFSDTLNYATKSMELSEVRAFRKPSITSPPDRSVYTPIGTAHLRIARPTDNIEPLRRFYCRGLGFEIVYEFKDHDGFDGLMVGFGPMGYHLEFTRKHGHEVGKAPTQDNLLVFYLPDKVVWEAAITRMNDAGYDSVKSFNPYWDVQGTTFEDPDGYRIVLQNAEWINRRFEGKCA